MLVHDAVVVDDGSKEFAHDVGLGQLRLTDRRRDGEGSGRAGSRRRSGCELRWRKLGARLLLKVNG